MSRFVEGKPWEHDNGDGTPNRGSYAFQAVLGSVHLAHDLLRETQDPPAEHRRSVEAVTDAILLACDLTHARLIGTTADRMANSHTRCRAAVRSAIDLIPFPGSVEPDTLDKWALRVADLAGEYLDVAGTPERCTPAVMSEPHGKQMLYNAALLAVGDVEQARTTAIDAWQAHVEAIDGRFVRTRDVTTAIESLPAPPADPGPDGTATEDEQVAAGDSEVF